MTVAFEKLGRLLACGPAILYACRAYGDFGATYISDNVQMRLGYAPEQFTAQNDFWLQHIHPQDRDRVVVDLAGIFEHDSHVHEYRFLHADGTYRWMRDELGLIRNEQGEPDTIFGFWTDITERKQTEQDLAWNNALLAGISRTQEYYIQEVDPQRLFDELLGDVLALTQSEYGFIGEILFSESRQQQYLLTHAITNIAWNEETRLFYDQNAPSGLAFYNLNSLFGEVIVTGNAVIANEPANDHRSCGLPEGHPAMHNFLGLPVHARQSLVGMIGIANRPGGYDETLVQGLQPLLKSYGQLINAFRRDRQLRQAEEGTRNSAIRLNAIFSSALDGIVTVTEQGCIESINPAGEQIFGYTQTELAGKSMGLLMTEPFRAQYQHYLASYLQTNVPRVIGTVQEIEGLRKGGMVMPIEVSLGEMKLGSERRFIAVVRDISERKKLDLMKNEFISVVSHELRTPLTAIRGSLGLLQGQFADQIPTPLQPLIDIANSNCLRLASLVDDLLDMEKMLSGHMSVNREVIDVQPLIEQTLASNQPMADQFQVRLRLRSCVPGRVLADHGRLLQVFANLLSNAAKFSPANSEVLVDVTAQDGTLRFSVQDHGEGVPLAFQDKIFDKFVQVDASSQRQRGGTGLGLSITKALVETMGGSIGLYSEPGKGSVFYFELPEHS